MSPERSDPCSQPGSVDDGIVGVAKQEQENGGKQSRETCELIYELRFDMISYSEKDIIGEMFLSGVNMANSLSNSFTVFKGNGCAHSRLCVSKLDAQRKRIQQCLGRFGQAKRTI